MSDDGKVIFGIRADNSKIDDDLDEAESKIKKKTSRWGSLASNVSKLVAGPLGKIAKSAANEIWNLGTAFEDGMAKVSTLVDTSVVDMDKLGDELLSLSSKYGLEAASLAESAYNAISSNNALGQDTAGLMAVLESSAKLAKAGFTDLDTATSATLKTLNAYGLGVEEVDRIQKIMLQTQNTGSITVDELGSVLANVTPTAAAMGVNFENVGAALATMTAQGTPAATATTQLNSLLAELGKKGTTASNSLAKATRKTDYAGMSFTEMMEAGVPLNEVLDLMAAYAGKNDKSLLDMFGSIEAGKAALSLTGTGSEMFTENLKAMSTEADVVNDGFTKVNETASQKLNTSFNKLKNSAIQLYQAFAPILTVLIDMAAVIVDKLTGAITKISGWLGTMSTKVVNLWKSITQGGRASVHTSSSGSTHGGGAGASFAVGADYIPSDDYPALLHRGEAVLTAAEAKVWREGGNTRAGSANGGTSIDYDRLADAIAKRPIVLDGEQLANLMEGRVSSVQARRGESVERSGYNGRI